MMKREAATTNSGDAALTPLELDRRERNRSKVRRSYYRKIVRPARLPRVVHVSARMPALLLPAVLTCAACTSTLRCAAQYNINELRAQVDVLEDEYERILQEQEELAALHADVMASEMQALEPTPSRQWRLRELAQARKSLYNENEALRRRQMEHDKAQGSLQHLVDDQLPPSDASGLTMAGSGAMAVGEVTVLRNFTIDECLAVTRAAYARITAYTDAQRLKAPRGTVLGWSDRRRVEDNILSSCFQKTFPARRFEDVGAATWALLTSPTELSSLYSPYVNARHCVVQRVDANNIVIFRTFEQLGLEAVQKSVYLMTRFQVEHGEILVRPLATMTTLEAQEELQYWTDAGRTHVFLVMEQLAHPLDPNRVVDNTLNLSRLGKRELWDSVIFWCVCERGGTCDNPATGLTDGQTDGRTDGCLVTMDAAGCCWRTRRAAQTAASRSVATS